MRSGLVSARKCHIADRAGPRKRADSVSSSWKAPATRTNTDADADDAAHTRILESADEQWGRQSSTDDLGVGTAARTVEGVMVESLSKKTVDASFDTKVSSPA